MGNQMTQFRRLSFFTGFFTTADDWNDGETYHIEKRKLHNRALHRPGILPGVGDELAVLPGGQLCVEVKPGAALDGYGNLMLVNSAKALEITPPSPAAQTAYITIQFAEKDDCYEEDPDFDGYKRKLEDPLVQCTFNQPDGAKEIELARVGLAENALTDKPEVVSPDNPTQPKANEIDRGHALFAGARDPYFAAGLVRMARLYEAIGNQQRRHNLGLHTPGVLHKVEQELQVRPMGGLTLRVEPGAALDGLGNELYLDETVDRTLVASPNTETVHFVVASYREPFGSSLQDLNLPFPTSYRTADVTLTTAKPDGATQIQLARIALAPGATEITAADDPEQPRPNEIDMTSRLWSAARELSPEHMDNETQKRVNILMVDKRENFAALVARFATPSMEDLRTAALQLRLMLGSLEPDQLPRSLHVLADLEQDVAEELAVRYPPIVAKPEFRAYQKAVADLLAALDERPPIDALLTGQAAVNSTVRDLAEIVFPLPVADAGKDQTVQTPENDTLVELDGSGSMAAEGQRIVRYIWEEVE